MSKLKRKQVIEQLGDRRSPGPRLSAEEFQRVLDCAPQEDVEAETAAELREALQDGGPRLTLDEMKREIGIA